MRFRPYQLLFAGLLLAMITTISSPAHGQGRPDLVWMRGAQPGIISVAISPDGSQVASGSVEPIGSGSDFTVVVWRVSDGMALRTLHVGGTPRALMFSADGKQLITADQARRVTTWDVASGSTVRSFSMAGNWGFQNGGGAYHFITISRDGRYSANGGTDGIVRIYRVADGILVKTIAAHPGEITGLVFSWDATQIASTSGGAFGSDNAIRVWRVSDGVLLREVSAPQSGNQTNIAFSPDGLRIALWYSGGGLLLNLSDGSVATNLHVPDHRPSAMAFSPDGRLVVCRSSILNVADGSVAATTADNGILDVTFSANNLNVVSGGVVNSTTTLAVYDATNGSQLQSMVPVGVANMRSVTQIAVSPDGKLVIAANQYPPLSIRRASDGSVQTQINSSDIFFSPFGRVAFSPDSTKVAGIRYAGTSSVDFSVLSVSTGALLQSYHIGDTSNGGSYGGNGFTASADWQYFAALSFDAHSIDVFRLADGVRIKNLPLTTVECWCFSPDGKLFATPNSIYRTSDWSLFRTLSTDTTAISAAFSPDSSILAIGHTNGNVGLWDTASGAEMPSFNVGGSVNSLAFSPDGMVLAASSSGTTTPLGFWSIHGTSLLASYKNEVDSQIFDGSISMPRLAYSPDGKFLYYGRIDGTVAAILNPVRNVILPDHGGNNRNVTAKVITAFDFPMTIGTMVKLTSAGKPPIVGTPINLENSYVLDVTFDLRGVPLEKRDVVITNPDGSTRTYPQGFTIEQGVAPHLTTQVIGRTLLRAGASSTYTVIVQNLGNTDSDSTDVRIQLPSYFTWQLSEFTAQDVFTGVNSTSFSIHVGSVPGNSSITIPIHVFAPDDPKYAHQIFSLLAWVNSDPGAMVTYIGDLTEELVSRVVAADKSEVEFRGNLQNGSVSTINSLKITNSDGQVSFIEMNNQGLITSMTDSSGTGVQFSYPQTPSVSSIIASAIDKRVQVYGPVLIQLAAIGIPALSISKPILLAAGHPTDVVQLCDLLDSDLTRLYNTYLLNPSAYNAIGAALIALAAPYLLPSTVATLVASQVAQIAALRNLLKVLFPTVVKNHFFSAIGALFRNYQLSHQIGTSGDPNDLQGPFGFGAIHWISGQISQQYVVHFENEHAAFAAQTVIVTNHLDPAKFDLTTISLGAIALPEKTTTPTPQYALPVGSREFDTDVNLPAKNLIARIHASLDMLTGDLTWTFLSIDPATGLPLDPADANGFLAAGEEGSVSFSVLPKSGMPTGSVVTDSAVVVFDGKPLATPHWSNTLDANKPTSIVRRFGNDRASLLGPPPVQPTTSFPVSWAGADVGSGVGGYTIEVSDNGGAFKPWLTNTTDTKAVFPGRLGHLYAFRSAASDHAGNIEATHALPDARTLVIRSDLMDVTDQLNVLVSPVEPLRAKGIYEQSVRLTNTGGKITGPISVVLEGLSSKVSVTVVSGTTSTVAPAGSPYIDLPTANLAPGATAYLLIRFTAASKSDVSFAVRVLAGPGMR